MKRQPDLKATRQSWRPHLVVLQLFREWKIERWFFFFMVLVKREREMLSCDVFGRFFCLGSKIFSFWKSQHFPWTVPERSARGGAGGSHRLAMRASVPQSQPKLWRGRAFQVTWFCLIRSSRPRNKIRFEISTNWAVDRSGTCTRSEVILARQLPARNGP